MLDFKFVTTHRAGSLFLFLLFKLLHLLSQFIHHGAADALVPLDWSVLTCDQLTALGKNVQCTYYPDMPHTFYGSGDQEFIQNTVQFFNQYLKAP